KQPGVEPSTRMAMDADLASDRKASPARWPGSFSEVDQVNELKRILAARPQPFRIQFFGVATDRGPAVLTEIEIRAADPSGAIRAAVEATWPARAIGLRVLDREGHEIFKQLK